ncbi:GspE/PulE family protein [Candidatus Omnitrophota bacterium]
MKGLENIKQILLDSGVLKPDEIDRAERLCEEKGSDFDTVLIEEGYAKEEVLLSLLSKNINVPMVRLKTIKIEKENLRLVPEKILRHHEMIPLAKIGRNITLAISDPLNIIALDDAKNATGFSVIPVLASSVDIQRAFETYFSEGKDLSDILDDVTDEETDGLEVISESTMLSPEVEGLEVGDEAPVIKMVNLILQEAIKRRSSDIHFEMFENKFRVRFRIDGVLHDVYTPPAGMHGPITARLKIMSELDITERRVPQDGRFKIRLHKKEVDFRVSVLPCIFGEKTVLRILDKSSLQVGLDKLGYLQENLDIFKEAIKRPYGMILVTGPTGSGKSTTLYSILNLMNTPYRNIMTVEDPVEYQVEGITQTQVRADIGLTFAAGLRSLLRQSPDIILVGEIRDGETADIAVKSALTGHLVFSTLHTNSACGAVTRLVDMGVEPFLIASSLVMVAAQRLCRKICENCKEEYEVPDSVLERLNLKREALKGIKAYQGKGCSVCNGSGYYGRMGTIECLVIDDDIRQLILRKAPSEEIQELAVKKGMVLLFKNLFKKFELGQTTLEEVLRIASAE